MWSINECERGLDNVTLRARCNLTVKMLLTSGTKPTLSETMKIAFSIFQSPVTGLVIQSTARVKFWHFNSGMFIIQQKERFCCKVSSSKVFQQIAKGLQHLTTQYTSRLNSSSIPQKSAKNEGSILLVWRDWYSRNWGAEEHWFLFISPLFLFKSSHSTGCHWKSC